MSITVNEINERAKSGKGFILECEKEYHTGVRLLAEEICADPDNKIILLAGPSGSGKTTTAHLLRDELRSLCKHTEVVSLDDFYLNRADAPRDSEGNPDFETVYSLDIAEVERCFSKIIKDGKAELPLFDFMTGTRKAERKTVDISDSGLMIVEGLHALNPLLYETLPQANLYKIYISVNCDINYQNGQTAIESKEVRFIRRTSRDSIYRNCDALSTLKLWEKVVSGEKQYLYGFKDSADKQLSTLHPFELCVLKDRVLKMLSAVDEGAEDYDFIKKIMNALKSITSLPEEDVPQDSLIREFIPGGKYE